MEAILKRRLTLQLLFILLAAILVAALSVILITDAVKSAEGVVVNDASRTLAGAVSELDQQYQERAGADSTWRGLALASQDTSLRGTSQAVLRSYSGVEGGFYDGMHFLGYSYPTHDTGGKKTDVPVAELDDILATISRSRAADSAQRILRGQRDIVVIDAKTDRETGYSSWAMKRLSGQSDPGTHRREILLAALVLAALLSITGTLATGIMLRRGVVQIKSGLAALEADFSHRLPERNDELGEISHSINRMAEARQRLETGLRREDRLRTIGRLVAGIAHEIRNPLNSIKLSIQYLERRIGGNSVRAEDFRPVVEEVDRLSALLATLLTFQKTREPALVERPLVPVLEQCVGLVRRQADLRNVIISTETPQSDIAARFDPEQLTQVLMNLLLNAVEAAGPDGTVGVRVARRDATIGIEVRDSGPGLSDEQREHLFEAFYTTKEGGTGLGLAVSRELAVGMGGALYYRNNGQGATFEIELPAAEQRRADYENAECNDTHSRG
jgi:signal transduction histidine kinase